MENKDFYEKKVEEGSKIRYEINEVHYKKELNPLQEIARHLIGISADEFKILHDMNYYREGGFPFPESPPKLDALLEKFILVVKYFYFIGQEDRIKSQLEEQGIFLKIEIPVIDEPVNMSFLEEERSKNQFLKAWKKVFADMPMNYKNKRETLIDLLGRSYNVQRDICNLANTIKKDIAPVIEEECGIKKNHFETAVQLKFKEYKNYLNNKDNEEEVQKVKDDINNQIDAISIFE